LEIRLVVDEEIKHLVPVDVEFAADAHRVLNSNLLVRQKAQEALVDVV
jgi:hypothetical protein